jgi:hypothetical protein
MAGGDHGEHELYKLSFGGEVFRGVVSFLGIDGELVAETPVVEVAIGPVSGGADIFPYKHFVVDVTDGVEVELLAVHLPADDDVSEFHFVAGECACFIGEDVFDLSELFVYADCSAGHVAVVEGAVHLLIYAHEVALEDLDELEGDDEADGDEGAVEDEVGGEGDACLFGAVDGAAEQHCSEGAVVLVDAVDVAVDGAADAAEDLEGEDEQDHVVDFAFDVAGFCEGLAAVHHDRGVLPGVYHQSDGPVGVLQFAPPQQHVLLVYALRYGHIADPQLQLTVEGLYVCGGLHALYRPGHVLKRGYFVGLVVPFLQ